MELTLKEHLFAENKTGDSGTELWKFEMTRTIAALYNSGGGILRAGVEDDGTVSGVKKVQDYAADKSELAKTLHEHLDFVPPFESVETDGYVEIIVGEGVLFPSILRKELKSVSENSIFSRRRRGNESQISRKTGAFKKRMSLLTSSPTFFRQALSIRLTQTGNMRPELFSSEE